jgi:hypothetical protein
MHSLTSALDGGEWSASIRSQFTPRKRAAGTHWIGGWVVVFKMYLPINLVTHVFLNWIPYVKHMRKQHR